MPAKDLEYVKQLVALIFCDQTEMAKIDVFKLLSKEQNQQVFVDKLYLHRMSKETQVIILPQSKFEVAEVAFKCILESSIYLSFQASFRRSRI